MIALYFKIKGERQIPFGEQLKAGFSPHPRIHMFSPAAGFHFVYVCAVTGESHVPCRQEPRKPPGSWKTWVFWEVGAAVVVAL